MQQQLVMDVYVDLVCPWCLIGKRQLDRALAEFTRSHPETLVDLRWHSVQLLPQVPAEGLDFMAFYIQRLGTEQAVRQRQAQVIAAAQVLGLQLDFSQIKRMPNTLLAHQLLSFAAVQLSGALYAALLERLFAAHFKRGENLGERTTLLRIAAEFALDPQLLDTWLERGAGKPLAHAVPGVPFFVFNGQVSLSGAQPAPVLLAGMQQALSELHPEAAL